MSFEDIDFGTDPDVEVNMENMEERESGDETPLARYLREINEYPLLSPKQEKAFARLHRASNKAFVGMAKILGPQAISAVRRDDALGEDLRQEAEKLRLYILDRHSRLQQDEAPNTSDAHKLLAHIVQQATSLKVPLRPIKPRKDDQAAFLSDLFGLMKSLPGLCNRVCTSEIEEIPLLVALLRETFTRLEQTFPSDHPVRKAIDSRRMALRDLYLQTPECHEYVQERLANGSLQNIDETTARETLVRANLRLVVSRARKESRVPMALLDRIQDGNLGLHRAVEGYDPARGTRFSTYATPWIKQSIRRGGINAGRMIRIPAYMVESMAKVRRAQAQGKPVTLSQKKKNLTDHALGIRFTNAAAHSPEEFHPLNAVASRDGEMLDLFEAQENLELLPALLDRLDQRHAAVLRARFGLNDEEEKTLKKIGETLGLTRERVRQIEEEALMRLRELFNESHNRYRTTA